MLLSACAALRPDQYVGNGLWMRGDGTTYEAPAPIPVVDAEIVNSRVDTRTKKETSETENEEGQKVIREVERVEMETGLDIVIILEDGSTYSVYLQGTGRLNSQVTTSASFTASNGYIYQVAGTIYQNLDRPRVALTITSKGPIRYQNTLVAP